LGLLINLFVAVILRRNEHSDHSHAGHDHSAHPHPSRLPQRDLNVHSAYLHVIGDAISSVGVIVAAILIYFTKANWLDPLMSVIIGIIILSGSYRVLRGSIHILVEGVPEGISVREVMLTLQSIKGVRDVHDLHIWNICSGHVALSAHLMLDDNHLDHQDDIIQSANRQLVETYQIEHTTIQVEKNPCSQPSC
jgi:cobalt-zinc-cadmium efflux system protein